MRESKTKLQKANASQFSTWCLLFISLFSGCSGNAPPESKHGSKHFDHYVIEVFAMSGQKEPIDGVLSVEVEAKEGIKDILTEEHNSNETSQWENDQELHETTPRKSNCG